MTGSDGLDARLVAATAIIHEAGRLALRYFRSLASLEIREKARHDIVTEADLAVDALIRARLAAAFPHDGVLTEESGGTITNDLWVIDPIDGTTNFARGIAHFAISIAFQRDGQTELGLILDPCGGELFSARRGGGASCNEVPIATSRVVRPDQALIDAGYSERRPLAAYHGLVGRLLEAGYGFSQCGSAALGLAYVACGRFDGFCESDLFAWDVLAGLLLVHEAGGWASVFTIERTVQSGRPVLASAPALALSLRKLTEFGVGQYKTDRFSPPISSSRQ